MNETRLFALQGVCGGTTTPREDPCWERVHVVSPENDPATVFRYWTRRYSDMYIICPIRLIVDGQTLLNGAPDYAWPSDLDNLFMDLNNAATFEGVPEGIGHPNYWVPQQTLLAILATYVPLPIAQWLLAPFPIPFPENV